jgi:hypothetical protein
LTRRSKFFDLSQNCQNELNVHFGVRNDCGHFFPNGSTLNLCSSSKTGGLLRATIDLAGKRGNPKRLMDLAIVTLVFINIAPLCMLAAPVIVLAAFALPSPAWQILLTNFRDRS